jgi:hypothetical protein
MHSTRVGLNVKLTHLEYVMGGGSVWIAPSGGAAVSCNHRVCSQHMPRPPCTTITSTAPLLLAHTLLHTVVRCCKSTGGALVWIAPSGGRDRPDADGKWTPDPFDPTAVELMASLIGRAKKPGHLYPMAMYSYPIMPPPKKVGIRLLGRGVR